jgi:hypothetical protein
MNIYITREAAKSNYFSPEKKAVFINGMMNTAQNHKESALALSLLLMAPITGVYNQKDGLIPDLWECLVDKMQFDGPLSVSAKNVLSARKSFSDMLDALEGMQPKKSRAKIMEDILSRNPPAVTAFRLLRDPSYKSTPFYAHSQGNLILSNALAAVAAVDGSQAISGRKVFSFGSPTVNWPGGINHKEFAFTADPVALLSGVDWGFKISKLGVHSYQNTSKQVVKTFISHGFEIYAHNDPEFVVNRFRWGGWGMTFNMDEKGLAGALISMGRNLDRVLGVFKHLDADRNSDVDDVAYYYVEELKARPASVDAGAARHALKQHKILRTLLIKVMDEGWTTSKERDAMDYIRDLPFNP